VKTSRGMWMEERQEASNLSLRSAVMRRCKKQTDRQRGRGRAKEDRGWEGNRDDRGKEEEGNRDTVTEGEIYKSKTAVVQDHKKEKGKENKQQRHKH